ncbi:MAG: AAA family ATPase [Gammaproteobacteria bacterium]|nr:AAA family ATPase [Gammaproteobacteria bacterium]
MKWKRNVHKRYGTTLIETKSWQCRNPEALYEHLAQALRDHGVCMRSVGFDELLATLREHAGRLLDPLNKLLRAAIRHVKNSALSMEELRKRAKSGRERAFVDVLEEVLRRYGNALEREGACDFEDLVNAARDQIRAGEWKPGYRYVLVDEFQDISRGRMELVAALQGRRVAHFLVGDDWQSIYRFAGSDVGIVKDCGSWLGRVRRLEIAKVFRHGNRILGPTSAFVVRNPEQISRKLQARGRKPDLGITVVFDSSREKGIDAAIGDILSRIPASGLDDPQAGPSLLVLARYKASLPNAVGLRDRWGVRVECGTVHGAKGREADFVVVLDLNDGRYGFPSKVEDDPVLALVLASVGERAFPDAEERRLFYVATTRGRHGAYLVADSRYASRSCPRSCRRGIRSAGSARWPETPCPPARDAAVASTRRGVPADPSAATRRCAATRHLAAPSAGRDSSSSNVAKPVARTRHAIRVRMCVPGARAGSCDAGKVPVARSGDARTTGPIRLASTRSTSMCPRVRGWRGGEAATVFGDGVSHHVVGGGERIAAEDSVALGRIWSIGGKTG